MLHFQANNYTRFDGEKYRTASKYESETKVTSTTRHITLIRQQINEFLILACKPADRYRDDWTGFVRSHCYIIEVDIFNMGRL